MILNEDSYIYGLLGNSSQGWSIILICPGFGHRILTIVYGKGLSIYSTYAKFCEKLTFLTP